MDKILRNVILFVSAIFVLLIVVVVLKFSPIGDWTTSSSSSSSGSTSNSVVNTASNTPSKVASGEVQNVKLTVVGGTYILTPGVLKKDVPVRMEADLSSVKGCARSIVISQFGVRKSVKTGDNIIEFTPTKTGTIKIACSMNMYTGEFIVEDSETDSTTTTTTQAAQVANIPVQANTQTELSATTDSTPVHTCGGSGGSCGCGASTGGCGCGG